MAALKFTNKVGANVEEDYYPITFTEYERVTIDWWTHKIGRLQKDDFIMAAKTDELFESV